MANRVYGIDLGTTNSTIAEYLGDGVSRCIILDNGKTTMPSCIMYKDGEIIVGEEAYNHRHQSNVIYSAKRHMGSGKIYYIWEGYDYDAGITLRPQDVGAEVIKGLVAKASYLYPDIKDVTITVPAEFNDIQRKATAEAGRLAGLNVISIINEPTAASLCYETKESETVLVYDLGGGTFDVSVVEITKDDSSGGDIEFDLLGVTLESGEATSESGTQYRILANAGDSRLGGDDIDDLIFTKVMSDYNRSMRLSGVASKAHKELPVETLEKIKRDIEGLKKTFSSGAAFGVAEIPITGTGSQHDGGVIMMRTEDVAEATFRIYKRTRMFTNKAIVDAGITRSDLSKIVLVGGSTKSKFITEFLANDFPELELFSSINPDECVGMGAAVQSAICVGESAVSVRDVVPQSICVESASVRLDGSLEEGTLKTLIKKNTPLPVRTSSVFSVVGEGSGLFVNVYQGDGRFVEESTFIGKLDLDMYLLEDANVVVTMSINTNGILEVLVSCNGEEVVKELSNVFGLETVPAKKLSPREKLASKWRRQFNKHLDADGPNEITMAIDRFVKHGSAEDKAYILAELEKIQVAVSDEEIIRQTSLFGLEE